MTGDDLRSIAGDGAGERAEHGPGPSSEGTAPAPGPERVENAVREPVLRRVEAAIDAESATVADGLVTESLDEILLATIARSEGETHGTVLMEELAEQFGTELSPGTVYPRLHGLDEEGPLAVHELVQTKQYAISDAPAARERVEAALADHLAIATYLAAGLEGL